MKIGTIRARGRILTMCVLCCGVGEAAVLEPGDVLSIGAESWFGLSADASSLDMTTPVSPGSDGGIVIGSTQAFGEIDTWVLTDSLGGHYTTSAPVGSTETGLDFSGWEIWWDGQGHTEMAVHEGVWTPADCDVLGCAGVAFAPDVAALSWSGIYGDSYSLWYSWRFNPTPGCFGCTMNYLLHLEGIVAPAPVPIPAAMWLFGPGLVLLLGVGRRWNGASRARVPAV